VESLMAGTVKGRAAIAEVYRAWLTAFPDVVVTSEDPLVDGLKGAQTVTQAGTDMGGFMGLPPTGKPFRLPIVHLYQFQDGYIQHERRIYDFTGLLVQIGVLKAKPA
jgi:predicted ester cyclase